MPNDKPQLRPLSETSSKQGAAETGGATRLRLSGRAVVLTYLKTMHEVPPKGCLALYVSENLEIIAPYEVAQKATGSLPIAGLIAQGHRLGAAGFLLVELNSDRRPVLDGELLRMANRLRGQTLELDMPLVDYLIVDGDEVLSVGGIRKSPKENVDIEL